MKNYFWLKVVLIGCVISFLLSWIAATILTPDGGSTPAFIGIILILSIIIFFASLCILCGLYILTYIRRASNQFQQTKLSKNLSETIKKHNQKSEDKRIQKRKLQEHEQLKNQPQTNQKNERNISRDNTSTNTESKEWQSFHQNTTDNIINSKTTFWQGTTKQASFTTFNSKLTGVITSVFMLDDGEFYIDIADSDTGEIHTVKEKEISTKIKVGSMSYEFLDLCKKTLKINLQEMFKLVEDIRAEARKPFLVKTFQPIDVTFTYDSKQNGQTRRTVSVTKYYKNKEGGEYFEGYCHSRNEDRMFKASNIKSKLKIGTKYYFFNEFIDQLVNK